MKYTINDIAELSGVAKCTVSRYLSGGSVSHKTKEIIDEVIKNTNYRPNLFAQSLRAKNSNLIGVIVPRINSFAVSLLLGGIEKQLRQHGYQMLISNTDQKEEREYESLYNFANHKVSAIILIATTITNKHIQIINENNMVVICVGQRNKKLPSVAYDDIESGYMMGKYIMKLGHKNIMYLGVTESDTAVGLNRKLGFLNALEGNEYNLIYHETSFLINEAESFFTKVIEDGSYKKSSVVVCATDNIALGVIKAPSKFNLTFPKDFSIVGFGDYEVADIIGLTTIHYPYKEAGKIAAEKIVTLLKGEDKEIYEVLKCSLKKRLSVKNIAKKQLNINFFTTK